MARSNGTTSGAAQTAAKSVGEDRPPGITKCSATSESELAKSSDEAGPSSIWHVQCLRDSAPQILLEKLGLLESQSTVPGQISTSQSLQLKSLVELSQAKPNRARRGSLRKRLKQGPRGTAPLGCRTRQRNTHCWRSSAESSVGELRWYRRWGLVFSLARTVVSKVRSQK